MYGTRLNEESEEERVKFARALVESNGNCHDAERIAWDGDVSIECDCCPFHCHQPEWEDGTRVALEKAKQYLLDIKLRKIIES